MGGGGGQALPSENDSVKIYKCSGYFLGLPHPDPLYVLSSYSLSFENDDSRLEVKMLFRWRTDSIPLDPTSVRLFTVIVITQFATANHGLVR